MKHLRAGFSPQQTSQALKREFTDNKAIQVSHETIYQTLYVMPQRYPRPYWWPTRCASIENGVRRSARQAWAGEVRLVGGVSIHERPADIEGRVVPNRWEGDLIKARRIAVKSVFCWNGKRDEDDLDQVSRAR
jgi:IS30 family transposase